jgi:hypothetical protein
MRDLAFACQARSSFLALAFGDVAVACRPRGSFLALAAPDQAGFAGACGTGGDVTFRYARPAA